jgi:hemoglobin-like flavoprotein
MDMLAAVVESLDQFDALRPRLAELGRKHVEYGVKPEQYESLKAALLWTLAQALGPDFDAATKEAWALAITAIGEAMKGGN